MAPDLRPEEEAVVVAPDNGVFFTLVGCTAASGIVSSGGSVAGLWRPCPMIVSWRSTFASS